MTHHVRKVVRRFLALKRMRAVRKKKWGLPISKSLKTHHAKAKKYAKRHKVTYSEARLAVSKRRD